MKLTSVSVDYDKGVNEYRNIHCRKDNHENDRWDQVWWCSNEWWMENAKVLRSGHCQNRGGMWIVATNEAFDKIVNVARWDSGWSINGESFESEWMKTLCTGSMMPMMRRATIAMHAILFMVIVVSVGQEIIAKQNETFCLLLGKRNVC